MTPAASAFDKLVRITTLCAFIYLSVRITLGFMAH